MRPFSAEALPRKKSILKNLFVAITISALFVTMQTEISSVDFEGAAMMIYSNVNTITTSFISSYTAGLALLPKDV
jgi:hypothetical protein